MSALLPLSLHFKIKLIHAWFGYQQLFYAFVAWRKLITNTQDDFSPIGMNSREVFFYVLTGG